MTTPNLPDPDEMTADERAAEIITILAIAITRRYVANNPVESAVNLGFVPDQRVHTTPYQ
jgi:stage V sporulation protein SpoVS